MPKAAISMVVADYNRRHAFGGPSTAVCWVLDSVGRSVVDGFSSVEIARGIADHMNKRFKAQQQFYVVDSSGQVLPPH